jgi:tRNA(Ile)-lysidine synthase
VTRRAAPAAGASQAVKSFTPAWLARRLRELIGPLRGQQLCVAFSGGADSTALLAALASLRARHQLVLRALHVNHHLQPAAAAMAHAARASARRLGVPCQVLDAPVRPARGESPEAAARVVRYEALRAQLRAGEWLLLAQHQDDQVETLLLQLLRGAGVAGLAASPERAGPLLRPLLPVTRTQLQAWLKRRGLGWSEDPSNADERHARNFLRLKVLPLLRERWPALSVTLSRSAALAAEAQQLLAARADAALMDAVDGAALRVTVLRRLAPAERRNALRRWLQLRGLPMPDQRRLQELAGPLLYSRHDAQPFIRWPGALVRRHGDRLHAAAEAAVVVTAAAAAIAAPTRLQWDWLREPRLALPAGGALELRADPHGDLLRAALPPRVRVAFRAADGSVAGRAGGRRLKRLLQQQALPPWQRRAVPLLYAGARLLAAGEHWQADAMRAGPHSGRATRCRLVWRQN